MSREIAAFGAFVIVALAHLLFPERAALEPAAVLLGFATLFAADRVYDPVRGRGEPRLHSADTLGTGLLVAALLREAWPVVVGVTAVKLALAGARALRKGTRHAPHTPRAQAASASLPGLIP